MEITRIPRAFYKGDWWRLNYGDHVRIGSVNGFLVGKDGKDLLITECLPRADMRQASKGQPRAGSMVKIALDGGPKVTGLPRRRSRGLPVRCK